MTRDELVTLLAWRLGNRKDMGARILSEMDLVQATSLEGHAWLPWFLVTELSTTTTVAGERRVKLPDNFLQEIEDSHLWLYASGEESKELIKGDYDFLKRKYVGEGRPVAYAIYGDYFQLFRTPDTEYFLEMQYFAKDARMSAENTETKWLKHASDVVIAAVGQEVAQKHLRNAELAGAFSLDLDKAWTRLLHLHTARMEINRERALGGDS